MNRELDSSKDKLTPIVLKEKELSYVLVSDDNNEQLSIPVISITYRDGLIIRSILSSSSNTTATISSDGECCVLSYVLFLDTTLSFGEYVLILTLVFLFLNSRNRFS